MAEEIALINEDDRFIGDSAKELLKKRWEKNKKLLEEARIVKLRTEYEKLRLNLAESYGFNIEEIEHFSKEELKALDEFLVFKAKKFRRNFHIVVNGVVPFLSVAGALTIHPNFLALLAFLLLDLFFILDGDFTALDFLSLRKKLQKFDEKGG